MHKVFKINQSLKKMDRLTFRIARDLGGPALAEPGPVIRVASLKTHPCAAHPAPDHLLE
jgi:hypothetical protein